MTLKIFKFGGASVRDAAAVRNVAAILRGHQGFPLVVVVSAMDKTTNALEKVAAAYFRTDNAMDQLRPVLDFHRQVLADLIPEAGHPAHEALRAKFTALEMLLQQAPGSNFDYEYDQIVAYGELFSSIVLSHFLNQEGIANMLLDARGLILTDNKHRDAGVNWDKTCRRIQEALQPHLDHQLFSPLVVTQGFIAGTASGASTTLGREGSDFSAAIFAYALNAGEVVIWKDVAGLYNADPKHFKNTTLLNSISFKEALELSYYGLGVIHPNTIKPLQNKNIPLWVKSFHDPGLPGTRIADADEANILIPCYIHKDGQMLLSIASRDFSYINETGLHAIFGLFSEMGIRTNVMQNSAISFSVCIDDPALYKEELLRRLQVNYQVKYNEGLRLITVRNYTEDILQELIADKRVLLEQRSRYTCQLVLQTVNTINEYL